MPSSMHAPIFNPIPFTKADYKVLNWNDLASRMKKEADSCYTPTYRMEAAQSPLNRNLAEYVTKLVNDQYLPFGFNYSVLFHIAHIEAYVDVGFDYRVQIGLAKTNCSNPPGDHVCTSAAYRHCFSRSISVHTTMIRHENRRIN